MNDINELLATGIQALKNGQREKARSILMQVIERDEKNEQAWLWLSGAVETNEDRRICLENVLTINPANTVARNGLAKLGPEPVTDLSQEAPPTYQSAQTAVAQPKYDDVWTTTEDICAYCAHPVAQSDKRCPQCNRKLTTKIFREPTASKYSRNLFIMLLVYTGLQIVGAVLTYNLTQNWAGTLVTLIFILPYVILTAGVYFRQAWAYWLIVAGMVLQLGAVIFILATLPPVESSGSPLMSLICLSPFLLFYLFIWYTIFMAGADFRRIKVRQLAAVSDRIKDANQYNRLGQNLAKKGMWASAILHWQRAVGRSPGHAGYHLNLAKAYARLGFYERSLDSLTAASEKTHFDDSRKEIQREIDRLKQQIKQQGTQG